MPNLTASLNVFINCVSPDKPVQAIISYLAGGSLDFVIRLVADNLGPQLLRADRWYLRSRIVAGLVAGMVAHSGLSMAQDYPARPVRIVHPAAQGGGGEIIARIVADNLTKRLGQQFLIDNRPGAGGTIGAGIVAKSVPDGYTLVTSAIAFFVIAPVMSPTTWDPMKDFTHIALFGGPPNALVVHPDVPARTLREFIAYTKSRPDGVAYGSPGKGTHSHLVAETFRNLTGAKLLHVPYKGGGPAIVDLVAGHLPATFTSLGTVPAYILAGKVRPLAITAEKRLPNYPELPTFAESGYGELIGATWFGLSGPAGLPRTIVNLLNAEVRAILMLPDVRKRLQADGVEVNDLDADAYSAFVKMEIDRWAPLAKAARSVQ